VDTFTDLAPLMERAAKSAELRRQQEKTKQKAFLLQSVIMKQQPDDGACLILYPINARACCVMGDMHVMLAQTRAKQLFALLWNAMNTERLYLKSYILPMIILMQ
jgi:hypothetical protein